jgi:Protein of unknown function (DUF3631)
MLRREKLAVVDAAAASVRDIETGPALRAQDRQIDVVLLLLNIIAIFRQRNVDRLRTSVLIESLSSIEGHRPWTGISSEDLCDAQKLARPLRPLRIRPMTIRFGDLTAKGYERRCFEKALTRFAAIPGTGTGLS